MLGVQVEVLSQQVFLFDKFQYSQLKTKSLQNKQTEQRLLTLKSQQKEHVQQRVLLFPYMVRHMCYIRHAPNGIQTKT